MTKPNPNNPDSLEMVKILTVQDMVSHGWSVGQAAAALGVASLVALFWYESAIRADEVLIEAVHEGRLSMHWFLQLSRSLTREKQRKLVAELSQKGAVPYG